MLSLKNHIYGLVIGCAIADSMGTVKEYNKNAVITTPYCSINYNIKPGYWTEPTGFFLLKIKSNTPISVTTSTGIQTVNNYNLLPFILQSAALCINYKDLNEQIAHVAEILDNDILKLWVSLIDGIINGLSKKQLFDKKLYCNLNITKTMCLLDTEMDMDMDMDMDFEIRLLRDVINIFRKTNNFTDGLMLAMKCQATSWSCALYGQIAGAYYGITDIPESWMDCLQKSDEILSVIEGIPNLSL